MTIADVTPQRVSPYRVLDPNEKYESYLTERQRYIEALINKWGWLLEGTKAQNLKPIPEHLWGSMALLFENQQHTHRAAMEATLTTDIALPQKFALPIIRKVFPAIFFGVVNCTILIPCSPSYNLITTTWHKTSYA